MHSRAKFPMIFFNNLKVIHDVAVSHSAIDYHKCSNQRVVLKFFSHLEEGRLFKSCFFSFFFFFVEILT